MKIKLLLILLIACHTLSAQEDTLPQYKSAVTLSLVSPFFYYAPRYNVGYMHKIDKRWWAGVEAGYGNYNTSLGFAREVSNNLINDAYKIFEIRPEIFYDLRPSSKLKHLLSAEFFYIRHTDEFDDGRYYKGLTGYRYDSADYRRIKTGLDLNYSLLFYFSDNFGLIWKTGMGFKKRDVSFTNVALVNEFDTSGDDDGHYGFFATDAYRKEAGTATNFNFNLDLKLFYKF